MSTSTTHRSLLGNFIHEIGVSLHNFHIGPINANNIQELIPEAVQVGNVIKEVVKDCQGITDPALLTKAAAESIIKHSTELPPSLQGEAFEQEAIKICSEVTNLPLAAVEAEVKALIAAQKTGAGATAV